MTAATMPKPSLTNTPLVTEAMKRQYDEEGYCLLPSVIPEDTLEMLREECSYFMGYTDGKMDKAGQSTAGITHRGKRYFIGNQYRDSSRMYRYIFSDLMAEISSSLLGPQVQLFNEQWVVKGAERGMKFAWHQDSGYVKHGDTQTTHAPYLSCWAALDDVDESNGTISILPHSKAGTKNQIMDHEKQEQTNDLVGYTGEEEGIPVRLPAGSIACFTSYTFHRSGSNTTPNMRRTYLTQYSSEPIHSSGGGLWAMAVPFVSGGQNVYDHADDTAANHGPGLRDKK